MKYLCNFRLPFEIIKLRNPNSILQSSFTGPYNMDKKSSISRSVDIEVKYSIKDLAPPLITICSPIPR